MPSVEAVDCGPLSGLQPKRRNERHANDARSSKTGASRPMSKSPSMRTVARALPGKLRRRFELRRGERCQRLASGSLAGSDVLFAKATIEEARKRVPRQLLGRSNGHQLE